MGVFRRDAPLIAVALTLAAFALAGAAPMENKKTPAYESAGAKKMGTLLRKLYSENDWKADPNKPAIRAEYYKKLLQTKLNLQEELAVRQELANEQLRAGDSQGAITTLENLRRITRETSAKTPPEFDRQLREVLAISYMRLGEQQNCLHFHGQKSCVFPLQASAVHQLPRGAEGAVRELTSLLTQYPADAESRWLLNVAYMQLGKYPQDGPPKWLSRTSYSIQSMTSATSLTRHPSREWLSRATPAQC